MSVTLQLPSAHPLDLIRFAWSPLFESVLSLEVVNHPKQTPMHLPWARRSRQLPEDLREEIGALTHCFDGFVPGIFEVGLDGDSPAFEDELAAFGELDDDLVTYEISLACGGLSCHSPDPHGPELITDAAYRDEVLASAAGDTRRAALARAAFDDPGGLRERYARMLSRYWEAAFKEEWERLVPRIEAEVTAGAHALVTGGAPKLVAEMLPEGRWDSATSSIIIEKDWDGACDIAERGRLLFVPTVYGWPRVLLEVVPPWPVSVIFPLRDLRQPAVPHASDSEVVDGFRALGDETRLQIARLVAEHPRSTKEIAQLLSLSDSAISRHLKIMESAGLVTSKRDGYFVLYGLHADRLDVLGRALRSTLGLVQGSADGVPRLPVSLPRVRYT
jgi:DNA-binding transcriptional ArsR family regulator